MTSPTVKVAVVEDTRRFSDALVGALGTAPELECVSVCRNAAEALAELPGKRPDVVLLDLDLGPGASGLNVLSKLVRTIPYTRFLILTVQDDPKAIFEAARRGASGYLNKSISVADLPDAVLKVQRGELRFSPDVLRLMWNAFQNPPPESAELEKLSPREAEMLDSLAQGFEPKDLAIRFNLSVETIKTHIRNIHKKLCVSTTRQAVL